MKSYFEEIKNKIKKKIVYEECNIIDNSALHAGHKFYDEKKYHLKLIIKSAYLNKTNRVEAQRLIFKILDEDLKSKIHALEIEIR